MDLDGSQWRSNGLLRGAFLTAMAAATCIFKAGADAMAVSLTLALSRRAKERRSAVGATFILTLLAAAPLVAAQQVQPPSDSVIRQLVADRLHWDEKLGPFDIKVEVDDRLVWLTGEVPTRDMRQYAVEVTEETPAVVGVVNNLRVDPGIRPARPAESPPEDATLRRRVEQSLLRHRGLDARDIKVNVTNGRVLLAGKVPTHVQRQVAAHIAASLYGVRSVENNIAAVP